MHNIPSSVGLCEQVQHLCSPQLSCHTQLPSASSLQETSHVAVGKCKLLLYHKCQQINSNTSERVVVAVLRVLLMHTCDRQCCKVSSFSRQELSWTSAPRFFFNYYWGCAACHFSLKQRTNKKKLHVLYVFIVKRITTQIIFKFSLLCERSNRTQSYACINRSYLCI